MATGNGLSFTILKNLLLIVSVLMVFASIYVGSRSAKYIAVAQQQDLDIYGYLRANVSCGEEADHFNSYNCYTLKYLRLSYWWFLAVVTLTIQGFSALVGIVGVYKESYELTLSYSALTAGVLLLSVINPSLLYSIVGPILDGIVMVLAFVFSRYLKNIQYSITSSKSTKFGA